MHNILEEYMTPSLENLDNIVERSDEFQQQKAKLNTCVKNYLKKAGSDKKKHVDSLLELIQKEQKQLAQDTFTRGFTLTALSTMETYLNRENYLALRENSPNPFVWGGEGRVRTVSPFVSLIINQLAQGRVELVSYYPKDPLIRNSENLFKKLLKHALLERKLDGVSYYDFEAKLYEINIEMLRLKSHRRFSFGYNIGEMLIRDLFAGRSLLVRDIPEQPEWD